MKISVVGGGRWARTIASVLCALPGRSDRITLHSPSNFVGLKAWVEQPQFAGRLEAADVWPFVRASGDRPDAVIVANRVREHFAAAAGALIEGIPVLVEKPIALSVSEIEDLSNIASANGTLLAASHVLLFARYFQAYAAAAAALGEARSLRFTWTDGTADIIRDEAKSYDAAVTVFDDVLPHILPMIAQLQFRDCAFGSNNVQRGGARLAIDLQSSERPVSLLVARNDDGRRRQIEIVTDCGLATLDFANEPGIVSLDLDRSNGDPLWDSAPRPLATMLTAFISAVDGGPLDPRMSPRLAIETAVLASAIRGSYVEHQVQWLEQRLGKPLDASLHYALMELSAEEDRNVDAVSNAWSAIKDRAGLAAFLSKSPLWSEVRSRQVTGNL
jgi:predicted dehydrogenase